MCQSLFLNNVAGLRLQFLKTPFLTEHLHGFMVKPQTSDIQVTYAYIRVTYGWHTSTYEWHKDDIRVHMSKIRMHTITYEWHRDDIPVHTNDIRMTYGWHAVRLWKKNKVIFFKTFWYFSSKISDLWKNSLHAMAVLSYLPNQKGVWN